MGQQKRHLALADARVVVERRPDGIVHVKSPQALAQHVRTVSDWLERWARDAPDRIFLAERVADAKWRRLTYSQCKAKVLRMAQGLLEAGLSPERPLMILSENSIDHAVLSLAAMHVGVPVVPVSVAYSLADRSLSKVRHIAGLVKPGLVFASDRERYAAALAVVDAPMADLAALCSAEPSSLVAEKHAATGPDCVAKILFTSGSTAQPKGVINTQRMLTASQQQSVQIWPFLKDEPPVIVDWLPWNHTFGGNYNFNLVLANGGTLYLDDGKPMPGAFDATLRNLREIAPTMYCNVPRGFELLLSALEADAAFRHHFFSRCTFVFYAAAALPEHVFQAYLRMGRDERGDDFLLVSAWGSTETAPLCTGVHYPIERAGIIGLPVPGLEVKLVPASGKLEARVRGPNITPGYFNDPGKTAAAFDEEGYYRMGDALRFADESAPERGLVFDGRVAEDFKLKSGTWVHVGKVRVQLISAGRGLIQDAVITGHDRDEVGALLFMNMATARDLQPSAIHRAVRDVLHAQATESGSGLSVRVARALVLSESPSVERGEITDKGYINQRFVLEGRKSEVERLYADSSADVIHI